MFILKKLASFYLFLTLSFLLLAAMTAGTLIPQNQTAEELARMFRPEVLTALKSLGLLDLYHSPWFISLLGLLGLNTMACIGMRLAERRFKKLPWGALVSHVGFLVILLGGMISGIRAEKGLLALRVGESQCCVPSGDKTLHLPFQLKLMKFNVDYYDGGRHYLQVADNKEGWKENLEVKVGEKYILKDKVRIEVLRHVPDFRLGKDEKTGEAVLYSASNNPNNPALQVSVTASPERKVWLFANFPGFSHAGESPLDLQYQYQPAKVKQFVSSVEVLKDEKTLASGRLSVNSPFRYGGYTFYQSGYDPRDPDFSSLHISKDPGVPFVYAGFIILPFGLYLSFYNKTPGSLAAAASGRKEEPHS